MDRKQIMKKSALVFSLAFLIGFAPFDVFAQTPPPLGELQSIEPEIDYDDEEGTGLPFDIRLESMKEAALSYGARGGLAWRTWEIRQELDTRASYMDKVFNFRNLLIPAPSGLLIEPPVISEAIDAMLIENGGLEAAVADRIYNISKNARIVSTPRTWRAYLEREWGEVTPPPDILRPQDEDERKQWEKWTRQGWEEGINQANEIFQTDLNQLAADYQGMVRYKMLLTQGMVSPPYALQVDRGVTGGGNEMRVGDRAVSIKSLPALNPGALQWQPASR